MKALQSFEVSGDSNSAKQSHIREDANLLGIPLLQECERLGLNGGRMCKVFCNGLWNTVKQLWSCALLGASVAYCNLRFG